jgi:phage baseplate assembly protein V
MIEAALENLANRLRMLVGRGRLTASNDSGPVQTQQVKMSPLETGDNRLRIAEFGFTSMPPIGSDAVVLFISGDRSAGVVIGTAHQSSRPRNLKSGETKIYSVDGKHVYLAGDHIEINANGQPVTVNNASTVTINASTSITCNTPVLKCTGDIVDNCNTNTRTMAGMRQVANSHTHNVTSVQTGGSTVVSNPPNQPMVMRDDEEP